MKLNSLKVAALAVSLAFTAGCAKKPPKELPPAPSEAGQQAPSGVENAIVPGSQADFLQSVPSDKIYFDTDLSNIDDQDRGILDAQAAWLQRYPNVQVTIEGHCDERGTREYNLALGDRRANAAKNYLQSRGINPARMAVISWGKERPEAVGSDEGSWARNRRAVTVVPQ